MTEETSYIVASMLTIAAFMRKGQSDLNPMERGKMRQISDEQEAVNAFKRILDLLQKETI